MNTIILIAYLINPFNGDMYREVKAFNAFGKCVEYKNYPDTLKNISKRCVDISGRITK